MMDVCMLLVVKLLNNRTAENGNRECGDMFLMLVCGDIRKKK